MAATCCSLVMSYLSWKRRELPIAISYGLAVLTGAFYIFGYAFEIVSTNLEQIHFWLRIEYIGIPFGPVLWFIMVLEYTGRQSFVRKWMVALLMFIPMLTFAAHYTNEWHHLFYKSMTINKSEGFSLVSLVIGPLYKVHVAYFYILVVIGMGFLIQMYRNMKKQIAIIMSICHLLLITTKSLLDWFKSQRGGIVFIVAVRDTGECIHSEQAHTLLQEDYPISTFGTAGERGVELGVTLCREFVRLNGGEIWLDSSPGQGSTFCFSIPTPANVFTPMIKLSEGRSLG